MAEVTITAYKSAVMGKQVNTGASGWNSYDDHMQVGSDSPWKVRSVVKFNLSAIPAGAILNSATLRLTYYSSEAEGHQVQTGGNLTDMKIGRMTADWGVSGPGPGEAGFTTGYEYHWDNRYNKHVNGQTFTNIDQTNTGDTVDFDVLGRVQEWYSGAQNYGFMLLNPTTETNNAYSLLFYGVDNAHSNTLWPKLIVDYTVNTVPNDPVNTLPTGGTTVNTLTPTFTADLDDDDIGDYITGYRIIVYNDTSGGFPSTPVAGNIVWYPSYKIVTGQPLSISTVYGSHNQSGYPITPLISGGKYCWRINMSDNAGAESSFTDLQQFSVNAPPSAPSVSVTPLPISDVPDNTPNISVTHNDPDPADTLMDGYRVVVEEESYAGAGDWTIKWDSGDVDVSGSPATVKNVTTGTLDWGVSHRVKARTQDSNGAWGPYSAAVPFTTHKTGIPNNMNPRSGELVPAVFNLSAQRSDSEDEITSYYIEVYTNDFQTAMWTSGELTSGIISAAQFSTTYAGSALSEGVQYVWRARLGSDIGGLSDWSVWQVFEIVDSTVPIVTSPVGDNDYSTTPTITITRTSSAFDTVNFEIYPPSSTTSALGTPHYQSGDINQASATSYSATYSGTAIFYNNPYKIRARVSSNGGVDWSDWSGLYWFTTEIGGIALLTSVDGETANPAWIVDSTPDFVVTATESETVDQVNIIVWDNQTTRANPIWNSGFTDVSNGATGTLTYAGPALVPGKTYYWTGLYVNTDGPWGPFPQAKQFRLNGAPSVPTSLYPPAGHVYSTGDTKTFEAVFADPDVETFEDGPTGWEIEVEGIDESPFDTETITSNLVVGLNTITWPGTTFVTGTEYMYRMRFRDTKNVWGPYSAWTSFKEAAPPNGTISTPSDMSTVSTVTPTVTWTYSGGTQERYTIRIDETDSNGILIREVSSLGPYFGTELSRAIQAGLLRDLKYYDLTLTVWNTDGLVDPSPSTVNIQVVLDAPNPITGVDSIGSDTTGSVELTWDETTLKTNHTFVAYRIERRIQNVTDWHIIAEVSGKSNTSYTDWYAGLDINYQYAVRAVTTKSGVGIEMESPDDSNGGSFAYSGIASENWYFIGADRSIENIWPLAVIDENHNRPIQQEVFETLGSDRKVIMRGFVLGHEGSITTLWVNTDIEAPEDEQVIINETWQGRRIIDYLTHNAGPHILKSPFGDVWDVQFASPQYTWLPTGHLEVVLEWVETGNTSRGQF